jgi:hypothetical protein
VLRLKGKYADAAPFYEKSLAYLEQLPEKDMREFASAINGMP